jgi:serine/threonine protein phosphatase PrpC/CRP-like cAMP-binding protein
MTAPIAIEFAALTDVGKKRDHNEDNFLVDKKLSLFIVCDGMGGHAAGEVASAIAVRTLHEEIKRDQELLEGYLQQGSGAAKVTKRDILNMLSFAANRASAKIHAEAVNDPKKRGMGTTLVGLLFLGNQAFVVHVGDSRVYLLRGGVLEQITEDHNVYNELVKRKKMSREQVMQLAPKNAITRAVGVYEHCEPDTLAVDVVAGDRFLLCTDGLHEYFELPLGTPEELGKSLSQAKEDAIVAQLIATAHERGGKDNITAVIVSFGGLGAKDEQRAQRLQLKRDTLARMPLFRPLNDAELRRVLQVTDVVGYADTETVIREGDRGEELFIVLAGSVEVLRDGNRMTELKPGEHFGEMALIRSQPRSATVRSVGHSELMVIRRSDFFEILRNEHQLAVKLLWQFTGVLAERLADTTRSLGSARAELAVELTQDDVTPEIFGEEDDDTRLTIPIPGPPSERPPS